MVEELKCKDAHLKGISYSSEGKILVKLYYREPAANISVYFFIKRVKKNESSQFKISFEMSPYFPMVHKYWSVLANCMDGNTEYVSNGKDNSRLQPGRNSTM